MVIITQRYEAFGYCCCCCCLFILLLFSSYSNFQLWLSMISTLLGIISSILFDLVVLVECFILFVFCYHFLFLFKI